MKTTIKQAQRKARPALQKFAIKRAQTELVRCLPNVSKLCKFAIKRAQTEPAPGLPSASNLSNASGLFGCEDFKKHMADLCDKQTDPAIREACRRHIKECAACRAYHEDFMRTVDLLTPKHAPSSGKTRPAAGIFPLQTTAEPKKQPSHKWIQIAAAVAIFMAGLGTGLSNFFSTRAEAVPSIPLIFDQSIKSSRSAACFSMSVHARTTPDENFDYFDPESGFVKISLKSLRQDQKTFWRLEKEGGRTIVYDDGKQYMWTTGGIAVCGDETCDFAGEFSSLLRPETLLEQQKAALSAGPQARAEMTETDSTITIVTHTDVYGNAVSASLLEKEEESYRCTTENVFSKRDGLLRQVRIWWERDGQKTLMLKSEHIDYNLPLDPGALVERPDNTQVTWMSAKTPSVEDPALLRKLTDETARDAARRILKALTDGKPQMAAEALHGYTAQLPELTEKMKGCKVSAVSQAKEKKGYKGVFVFYELTTPDGKTENRHIALRRDNPQGIWMVDGGL